MTLELITDARNDFHLPAFFDYRFLYDDTPYFDRFSDLPWG
jgi:hypothetical protein